MEQIRWTDRNFTFDFPVTMFPVYIARLRSSYPSIRYLVSELAPKQLVKPIRGGWSVKQHIGHLTDLEELHSGRLDDYRRHLDVLRPADMQNRKTETADHNAADIEALLSDFARERTQFIDKLLSFDSEDLESSAQHPRLQMPMRIVDLACFVAEHDAHHIARMWEAKNI